MPPKSKKAKKTPEGEALSGVEHLGEGTFEPGEMVFALARCSKNKKALWPGYVSYTLLEESRLAT